MKVSIRLLTPTAKLPLYATDGAAASDLYADLSGPVTVPAGGRALIPTGISAEVEPGWALFIFARSGLAVRNGVALSNGVGVIDSDYRGEIKVGLLNSSGEEYTVNPGDRIAQMALMPAERADFEVCGTLGGTARSSGGFGSTGRN